MKAHFSGSLVALITPFDAKGRIDTKSLRSIVRWHVEEGTDGIVCVGTTGEGCSLNRAEKTKLFQICLEEANGKMQVIAGTGTSDTRETVQLTEKAKQLGLDGALVVTPYYNRPTQDGCVAHFNEVSKVGLPIIVYHNPVRAGFRLQLGTVPKLENIPNVVAMKDSSHDLDFVRAIRKISQLPILSGDDDATLEILREGGVGTISVIGNFIPKSWKAMVIAALNEKWAEAERLNQRYASFLKAVFLETNPQGIKYLVSQMGKCKPFWRLPLLPPRQETQNQIKMSLLHLALPHLKKELIFDRK